MADIHIQVCNSNIWMIETFLVRPLKPKQRYCVSICQTFYKINRGMSMIIEPFALGVRSSSRKYLLRNSGVFIVVRVVCKLISVL